MTAALCQDTRPADAMSAIPHFHRTQCRFSRDCLARVAGAAPVPVDGAFYAFPHYAHQARGEHTRWERHNVRDSFDAFMTALVYDFAVEDGEVIWVVWAANGARTLMESAQ